MEEYKQKAEKYAMGIARDLWQAYFDSDRLHLLPHDVAELVCDQMSEELPDDLVYFIDQKAVENIVEELVDMNLLDKEAEENTKLYHELRDDYYHAVMGR